MPVFLALAVMAAGCGKTTSDGSSMTADTVSGPAAGVTSTGAGDSLDTEPTVVVPDSTESFERRVFRAYATEGVAIPRSVTDSIAKLADPRKMEKAMDAYMSRHDSLVRQNLIARYGITLDSLQTIIKLYDSVSRK